MMSEAVRDEKFIAADAVANDGYTNLPARLGEASPLQSSGEYTREDVTRNYELLTVLYRENWLAKRIIDMPCEDMTRAWYSISSELQQSAIDKIKKVEAKHNVKVEITNALRWARLYGGSLALMVIKGQEDMLDEPLDYDMIMPDSFKGLLVLDKVTGISPSLELEDDMDDPDFGLPMYYEVVIDATSSSFVRIHHSRVLRFIGRDLPPQEEIREDYWGASELEHIYEELQKRNATSANIAQLVFQANTRVLKMADYGEVIGMGTNKQKKEVLNAIEAQNRLLTSFGVQIMGTDDNMESHPYSFSGISDVYESFMMDMAGAANIPATKLFGRSPQGMNATGESDMNNYYESIAQMQERSLKPALEKLLPVMCMSIFGAIPDDMEIVFEPIATTSPEQRANISGQFTGTIIDAYSAGLIGRKTALMELREMGKEIGAWTKISDDTIEEADDEVDQGEMGGGMPGEEGMEMMGGEGQVPPEGAMPETQMPVEEGAEQTQVPVEEGAEQPKPEVEEDDEDIMQKLNDDLDEIQLEHDKVGFIQRMVERLFHRKKKLNLDGGEGSGNFNHKGRPGQVGGSGGGGGSGEKPRTKEDIVNMVSPDNFMASEKYKWLRERYSSAKKEHEDAEKDYEKNKDDIEFALFSDEDLDESLSKIVDRKMSAEANLKKVSDEVNKVKDGITEKKKKELDGKEFVKASQKDYDGFNTESTVSKVKEAVKSGEAQLVEMSPREYLERCAIQVFGESVEDSVKGISPENSSMYADKMKEGTKFEVPYLDLKGKEQEGRHRAVAAMINGIEKIPVIVIGGKKANDEFADVESATDGGPGSGNFGHAGDPPNVGGSAPSGGGSGGNHPTKEEIRDAAQKVVSGGFKKGIDRKGMDRHRNKENATRAARIQYEKEKKKYDKAIAQGKTPKREPVFFVKSYFDGVNADSMMRKCLDYIAKDKFDNKPCKWYDKTGNGELKCQITFVKDIGYTVAHGSKEMVPTRTVTVTYSRENGFHCYPDEKKIDNQRV